MAIPPNNLLALILGFGSMQGRSLKVLDIAEHVPASFLEDAVDVMRQLGLVALVAFWNEDDPTFKKDFGFISAQIAEGLKAVQS